MNERPHRGKIFLEDAEVLAHEAFAGDQHVLRVRSPECATRALPGQFAHLTCDPALPMRRPISILRSDPREGWVDFLYKAVGQGTRLLARRRAGEVLSVLGPIGAPFAVRERRPLLIGGGVGMPPMVFLADELRKVPGAKPFAVLGSEVPFPFSPRPSQFVVDGIPAGAIASMPLLEDWGVASRLASRQPGFREECPPPAPAI